MLLRRESDKKLEAKIIFDVCIHVLFSAFRFQYHLYYMN